MIYKKFEENYNKYRDLFKEDTVDSETNNESNTELYRLEKIKLQYESVKSLFHEYMTFVKNLIYIMVSGTIVQATSYFVYCKCDFNSIDKKFFAFSIIVTFASLILTLISEFKYNKNSRAVKLIDKIDNTVSTIKEIIDSFKNAINEYETILNKKSDIIKFSIVTIVLVVISALPIVSNILSLFL